VGPNAVCSLNVLWDAKGTLIKNVVVIHRKRAKASKPQVEKLIKSIFFLFFFSVEKH